MADKQASIERQPVFELLDFYATWCEPCKLLDPILETIQRNYGKALNIRKIDIDEQPDQKARFQISSVPVLLLLKNGEPVWRMNGFLMAPDLKRIFDRFLENKSPTG